MKAAIIHETGNEDVFRYEDVPDPEPRPRQVLLRIESASVNRGDLFRRDGSYGGGAAPSLPLIIGWDVAGTIIEVGSEVRGPRRGPARSRHPAPRRLRRDDRCQRGWHRAHTR